MPTEHQNTNMLDGATQERCAAILEHSIGSRSTSYEPIVGKGMSAQVIVAQTREGRFVIRMREAEWLSNFKKKLGV